MQSLFSNDPARAGYRMEYMEIFNWGTFDKEIFRISPDGHNSLLTGANGSGKTTYVDALLTLLVPIKKYRFYNRSSGADKKNERTEESYVLGAYGETQEEGKLHSQTMYIRPDRKKVYSILLACFANVEHQPITLFQARWFYNGELKRTYGICHKPLSIETNFRPFDPQGEWKKALKQRFPRQGLKEVIEFFDSGNKYAEKVVKYFGMRSEKALSLFNQTVGIKVLGNLDQFIRTNMLEPQEAEAEFINLKENYNTLLDAHRQIEKAVEQAKLLTPIRDLAQQVTETEQQLQALESLKETGNVYFNHRLDGFLAVEIEREKRELITAEQKMQTVNQRLSDLDEKKTTLSVAIAQDETGRRIKEIERQLTQKQKEVVTRKFKQEKYNKLAEGLTFPSSPDERLFAENREKALQSKENILAQIAAIGDQRYQVRKSIDEGQNTYGALEKEIQQLGKQKSKITGQVSEIRREIIANVQAGPDEIPFIGESIKVKDSQKDWEPAIERLLHNFALRLLVPDKYYDRVNRYVNGHNLRGRIVYHRVKEESFRNTMLPRPVGILMEKLDVKRTVYQNWLEDQLLKHYDYICVAQVAEFHKYKRAMTIEGLIKNADHHQKDDRPEIVSRERFVLGWDNKEKIMALARMAKELQKEINQQKEQLKKYDGQLKKLETNRENLIKILEYESFAEIDWSSTVLEIETLTREKKRLEETSDRIKQLQQELKEVEGQVKTLKKEHDELVGMRTLSQNTIRQHEAAQGQCREEISRASLARELWPQRFQLFEEAYSRFLENFSFLSFRQVLQAVEKDQAHTKEHLDNSIQKNMQRLSVKMNGFRNPGPDITDRFPDWRADTLKLSEDTRFADEYMALLERIEKEDLPSYRRKFEDYLSSTMINKIAGFKEFLDEGEESILENIAALNKSLEKISFKSTPATYIQLKCPAQQEVELRDFKKMLRDAIPNAALLHSEDSGQYKKEVFKQIQVLIDKLDKDELWRTKVIDVRNWKSYYAEEYYRENDAPMKVYKDMGKLSGGEKAQLTYTILGSAIAYQFGIKHKGLDSDSFRFIAVDESFSNQDDERATYLMDLCSQLHLQLLVVTPSDKIHIVEPYISYVHYVQRRSNRESLLFDMPIKEFQEQKEAVLTA
ncbi:MAG TPA: SbcC/MukB-like Walker B domain-containing protein [Candidatus Deferrimicrobium sp.]|nr:SbcC/MukB-like Walker B domain-containing protein [Candidatus Deferrimicrobium sp.]